ncbi:MAG TPA: hypothetical protein DEQ77_04745 [Candidatus Omnitrophica bacterium]|nr:hypothetical protein [Candidatus Omnitrophota bacterium]
MLIIDERLFRDVKAEREIPKVGKAALHSHWERMGVRFATLTGAGIVKNFKSDSVSLENFLRGARFDFISIHQALISDVIKGEWGKTLEMLRKATRNIIIHSARGDVSVLKGFKFIDYSNLRNVLIDRPDKQALADRLMSLTGEGGKT